MTNVNHNNVQGCLFIPTPWKLSLLSSRLSSYSVCSSSVNININWLDLWAATAIINGDESLRDRKFKYGWNIASLEIVVNFLFIIFTSFFLL